MSRAGALANAGYHYQTLIATHWLIRLLREPAEIRAIQAESMGLPGETESISVDDIVVCYRDGRHQFIQAKKNQKDHRAWSLSELRSELLKAAEQLEHWPDAIVEFYSRTPFGDLHKITEECARYADYPAFAQEAPANQQGLLQGLARVIERTEQQAFDMACRLRFGPADDYEPWEARNRTDLAQVVARADTAVKVLEALLTRHQSKLVGTRIVLTREDILAELNKHGFVLTPSRSEAEILTAFQQASAIGRAWPRTINDQVIPTPHMESILNLVAKGHRTVLVQGGPGSGKTCVLLDLADAIEESRPEWALLFIKADWFQEARTESDLAASGLPDDIVGRCARLSEYRRVVVVMDSLDVLSLNHHHGSLQLFLRLLDSLQKLDDVTTVVACREFDLKYDLWYRQWEQVVHISDLDFPSQVAPLLEGLGVIPESIPKVQRDLLCKPHLLKLYATLAESVITSIVTSSHDLFERFLDERVIRNPLLGMPAVEALQKMAQDLLSARADDGLPRVQFACQPALPSLCSLGILLERVPGCFQFGHQTWGDALSVRAALAQGQTLAGFIHDHLPLPFIRPSMRAFFFYLRTHQGDTFVRQVRAVINDAGIAYHLKRLIVESLAEIVPLDADWDLIRHLSDDHPDLFQRFIWRTQKPEWFDFLHNRWLPHALRKQYPEERLWHFIAHLDVWLKPQPAAVIACWRQALADGWVDSRRLGRYVTVVLDKFEQWSAPGLRELLETLLGLQQEADDYDPLGRIISRFVEVTGNGDNMLWVFITRGLTDEDKSSWNLGHKLRCLPHHFHSESFLNERLTQSETLLDTALAAVTTWRPDFLDHTSWRYLHHHVDIHPAEGPDVLFAALEQALRRHAAQDSPWWRQREAELRGSGELALRYLHLVACQENLLGNLEAAGAILQDVSLFREEYLGYELGQFMNAAYPFLPEAVWVTNQHLLLDLYQDDCKEERERDWAIKTTCTWLDWIPACCRLPETQAFLDHNVGKYFPFVRFPDVYQFGGCVQPPFSAEVLLGFTDAGIIQLMTHYLDASGRTLHERYSLIGGKEEVLRILRSAASMDPVRLLGLAPHLYAELPDPAFVDAVMGGLADHPSYRVGKLQAPQGWQPATAPEPIGLARAIVDLLERWPAFWKGKRETAEALLACANTLVEPSDVERLISPLFDCLDAADPTEERTEKNNDLIFVAINSTRGRAAKAAFDLGNRLLENDDSLPERLPPLLYGFASDPHPAVRALVLTKLPYTLHKAPTLGWALFAGIFNQPDNRFWPHAERCLYYQYHEHYQQVRPWLDRLGNEGLETAGDAWGRIAALICLSGNISLAWLFQKLEQFSSIKAWQGATQVFTANLHDRNARALCHQGLLAVLCHGPRTKDIIDTVERVFLDEANHPYIDLELAGAYLEALADTDGHCDLREFLKWLAYVAQDNPLAALEAAEAMLTVLDRRSEPCNIWSKEFLPPALTAILREADQTDDGALIRRAISLQDRLLLMNVYGMDELYELGGTA